MIRNYLVARQTKATVYWDESSRGKRVKTPGRWVGERWEHGRRVRFRSTDYNKVIAWADKSDAEISLPKGKRQYNLSERIGVPIVGFPSYSVDLKTGAVYGMKNQPLTLKKGYMVRLMDSNHKRLEIAIGKIVWATQHDVDPRTIPSDICIKLNEEGKLSIHYAKELGIKNCHNNHSALISTREHRAARAVREGDLLLSYYRDGKREELMQYIILQHETITSWMVKSKWIPRQQATDIALAAIDHYCQKVEDGTLAITTITSNLKHKCNSLIKEQRKKREYEVDSCKFGKNYKE